MVYTFLCLHPKILHYALWRYVSQYLISILYFINLILSGRDLLRKSLIFHLNISISNKRSQNKVNERLRIYVCRSLVFHYLSQFEISLRRLKLYLQFLLLIIRVKKYNINSPKREPIFLIIRMNKHWEQINNIYLLHSL